jgi:formate/nitrite transporter
MDRELQPRTPPQTLAYFSALAAEKQKRAALNTFLLALLGGAFVGLAAAGASSAAYLFFENPALHGAGKLAAGFVFGTALMLILFTGAELFTGNTLLVIGILDRRAKTRRLVINGVLVYAGNFAGCVFVALLINGSGLFENGSGAYAIKIAAAKSSLPFFQAFILGVLANWLVTLAVWLTAALRDGTGKILACFFVINLFVVCGFEHSVANMYYLSAGLIAKHNPLWLDAARLGEGGLRLSWGAMTLNNLLPVTLGNIIGGALFTGAALSFAHSARKAKIRAERQLVFGFGCVWGGGRATVNKLRNLHLSNSICD